MFSIPSIDKSSKEELAIKVRKWILQDSSIKVDIDTIDQAFNFALPRTIFLKSLPSYINVLDMGAGDGSLVNYKLWPYFERQDINMHALSLSKGENFDKYSSYEIKDFEKHANIFDGIDFQAIVCCHFLEHMRNPKLAIEFFAEKLSTDGRIYLEWPHPVTKNFPTQQSLQDIGVNISTLNFFDDLTHVEAWSAQEVIKLLNENGFEIEGGGRVHLPWISEQLKNHARLENDFTRLTTGTWAALGWAQYIIANKV